MLSNMVQKIDKNSGDLASVFKEMQDKEEQLQCLTSKVDAQTSINARNDSGIVRIDQTLKDVAGDIQKADERIAAADHKAIALWDE